MRNLSEKAKLSKIYTNHCIRKTCIVTLDKSGFEARHIIAVSSHKSETTIKEYSENCPDEKREEMYEALSKQIVPQKRKATATIPNPEPLSDLQSDLQNDQNIKANFDLQHFETDPEEDAILDNFLQQTAHLDNNSFMQQFDKNTNNESQIVPQNTTPPQPQYQANQSITQNFNNALKPAFPMMHIQNSNVTVNYNFYGQQK